MMGPFHRFRDPAHLDALLAEVRSSGISVKPDNGRAPLQAYWLRRGLGLVNASIGFQGHSVVYFGFGHPFNPLLWFWDRRLLRFIGHLFVANGSDLVDFETIAEQ
jgi:hypothetical protein